jgi:hypothetical protein
VIEVARATARHRAGIRRYCSGCARSTEHLRTTPDGRGSIASIRWRAAEPEGDTTTCLDCGQWRVLGTALRVGQSLERYK